MQFDNQKTRNVADVVAKILAGESAQQEPQVLGEELKGDQHKIDANKNKKIDSHDFKLLRAQKDKEKANSQKFGKGVKEEVDNKKKDDLPFTPDPVKKPVRNSDGTIQSPMSLARELAKRGLKKVMSKEEVEELDELSKDTLKSYAGKVIDKTRTMPQGEKKQKHLAGLVKSMDKMKEETEIDEAMFPGTKEYEKKYGESPQQKLKKKGDTVPTAQGEMKKTEKGVQHSRRFSEMVSAYQEQGLKYIASLVREEPDNEEFTKEVEEVKKKATQKKTLEDEGRVAKASVQAVKNEQTEIYVINADIANGVEQIDIEERSLTEPEMKKKEEMVMSMKKKMPGFKERYGDRAKEVIYAVATKQAKEKA